MHVSGENTVGDLQGAVGAEGRVARRSERENSRQRPPIGLHRGLGPLHDQRIAIPRGLGDEARLREARIIAELRNAEIDENGLVGLHHDVGGLEITVQNPGRVDGEDRLAQILSQLDQFPFGEPAAFVDVVLKGVALDELGDDERVLLLRFHVENFRNVRPLDLLHHADFTAEPLAPIGHVRNVRMQEFERDVPAFAVDRFIHGGHAAISDLTDYPIAANLLFGHHLSHRTRSSQTVRERVVRPTVENLSHSSRNARTTLQLRKMWRSHSGPST